MHDALKLSMMAMSLTSSVSNTLNLYDSKGFCPEVKEALSLVLYNTYTLDWYVGLGLLQRAKFTVKPEKLYEIDRFEGVLVLRKALTKAIEYQDAILATPNSLENVRLNGYIVPLAKINTFFDFTGLVK